MGHTTPALILTARSDIDSKVENFQAGADDYVVKPVAMAELSIRVQALLRRGPALQENVLKAGSLEINRLTRQVKRDGKRIELSPKEYSLLEYLFLHSGRVLSRSMIVEKIWDQSFEGLTNIVDVYIGHLRRKIDEGHEPQADPHRARAGLCLRYRSVPMMILRSVTSRLVLSYCLLLVLLGGGVPGLHRLQFPALYPRDHRQHPGGAGEGGVEYLARLAGISHPAGRGHRAALFAPESAGPLHPHPRRRQGCFTVPASPISGDFRPAQVRVPAPANDEMQLTGDMLLYSRDFRDASDNIITVDTGQSDQFSRTVQARLATSLFVGLPDPAFAGGRWPATS